MDEEEEEAEELPTELINEDVDVSEQRDLSYWHITIPRIDSIFERNKKVRCLFYKFAFCPLFENSMVRATTVLSGMGNCFISLSLFLGR